MVAAQSDAKIDVDIHFSIHTLIILDRQWNAGYTFEIDLWKMLRFKEFH